MLRPIPRRPRHQATPRGSAFPSYSTCFRPSYRPTELNLVFTRNSFVDSGKYKLTTYVRYDVVYIYCDIIFEYTTWHLPWIEKCCDRMALAVVEGVLVWERKPRMKPCFTLFGP